MLSKYNLPPYMDTSNNDLVKEFFIPMLKESIEYKRGVGFFSSGWFRMVSQGVTELISNGGRIQMITSPIISESDYQALLNGTKAMQDEKLYEIIANSIKNLEKDLEENTLSAIAWMIADGILEIKLAIPKGKLNGDFHDKFGIFIDKDGNIVAFSGSPNESIQGFQNYESIKIFPSWKNPDFKEIAEKELDRFEKLWNDKDPNLKVFSIPEAAKQEMIKLRKEERPYKKENILKAFKDHKEEKTRLPPIRQYQEEAVKRWKENNFKGLFEMATGTGKTLTSIFAINEYIKEKENILALIIVPYKHLIEQWEKNIKLLSDEIVICSENRNSWYIRLNDKIILQNKGKINNLFIISTIQTASRSDLLDIVHKSKVPNILVIDECHYAGATKFSKVLDEFFSARIGLSATPNRLWDDMGTEKIKKFFDRTVFEFPLEKAIEEGFLTKYEYNPIFVELKEEEFEEYEKISIEIGRLLNIKPQEEKILEKLERLLIKRAKILNKSENKIITLKEKVKEIKENLEIKHSLFYCEDNNQLKKVTDILNELNITTTKFTSKENKKTRENILKEFEKGNIEAIVAIKCLDEGVDIPPAKIAFFLSSSTNPRQFIQRRGRILRKSEGKEKAIIYDIITTPPVEKETSTYSKQILSRELERFKEFANFALNKHSANKYILELAKKIKL